jgi:hypothetical protein
VFGEWGRDFMDGAEGEEGEEGELTTKTQRAQRPEEGEWQAAGLVVGRRILREALGWANGLEGWELFYEELLLGFYDALLVQQRCLIELEAEPDIEIFRRGTVRDFGDWVGMRMEEMSRGGPTVQNDEEERVAWHEEQMAEEWARERNE